MLTASRNTYLPPFFHLGQDLGQDLGHDLGHDLGQDLSQDRPPRVLAEEGYVRLKVKLQVHIFSERTYKGV